MWQFEFYPDRELLCELGYMPRKRSISDPLPNKKDESIKLTVDSIYPFHSSIAFRKEFNKVMNAHGLLEYADTMLIIALIEDQQAVTYLELGKEASKGMDMAADLAKFLKILTHQTDSNLVNVTAQTNDLGSITIRDPSFVRWLRDVCFEALEHGRLTHLNTSGIGYTLGDGMFGGARLFERLSWAERFRLEVDGLNREAYTIFLSKLWRALKFGGFPGLKSDGLPNAKHRRCLFDIGVVFGWQTPVEAISRETGRRNSASKILKMKADAIYSLFKRHLKV